MALWYCMCWFNTLASDCDSRNLAPLILYVLLWRVHCSFNTLVIVTYLAPLHSYVPVDIVPVDIVRTDCELRCDLAPSILYVLIQHTAGNCDLLGTASSVCTYVLNVPVGILHAVCTCWYCTCWLRIATWHLRSFRPSPPIWRCSEWMLLFLLRWMQAPSIVSESSKSFGCFWTLLMGLMGSQAIKRGTNEGEWRMVFLEHECERRVNESSSNPEALIQIEMHCIL